MLDLSGWPELKLHGSVLAEIAAAARSLEIEPLIVGAFARDLHLQYAHRIAVVRQTADVDIALAVADWAAFQALKKRLIDSELFGASDRIAHRLTHRAGLPLDLVPFGNLERSDRTIAWPPEGEVVMNVFGFREASTASVTAVFPGGARMQIVSLPALVLLKLVAWVARGRETGDRDAVDLFLVLKNYLRAGNEARLWDEFPSWVEEVDFDYEPAGGRMVGYDLRSVLDVNGLDLVRQLVAQQIELDPPGRLPSAMSPRNPEAARRLLQEMLQGLGD
ncbi:MAG: nucleotidyl transferase AbiEii/AbiGii toxin family protein [Burkholderiales bacterium]|nr:nucleotidyl transferase AbiEii/AbiGii toxin family protein [Burkholderiales bacterium]